MTAMQYLVINIAFLAFFFLGRFLAFKARRKLSKLLFLADKRAKMLEGSIVWLQDNVLVMLKGLSVCKQVADNLRQNPPKDAKDAIEVLLLALLEADLTSKPDDFYYLCEHYKGVKFLTTDLGKLRGKGYFTDDTDEDEC